MTDDVRQELTECSVIFHSSNLSDFQQKINVAAAEIAVKEPRLVTKGNCGTPLDRAREKVPFEGYNLKRGNHVPKCMVQVLVVRIPLL